MSRTRFVQKILVIAVFTQLLLSYCVAADLLFDSETTKVSTELIFKTPQEFKNETYCYFVFQGVIDEQKITPVVYAKFVKGSTLSNAALGEYHSWLNADDGKKCRRVVGPGFRFFKADDTKSYSIFLNVKAIERDGESLEKTLNHEKLHVLFAIRKADRAKIQHAWDQLSEKEKTEFETKHPGYDYKNPDITLREYFSYAYEANPEAAEELLNREAH